MKKHWEAQTAALGQRERPAVMSFRLSATLAAFIAGVVLVGNPSSSQAQQTASVSGGGGLEEILVTLDVQLSAGGTPLRATTV